MLKLLLLLAAVAALAVAAPLAAPDFNDLDDSDLDDSDNDASDLDDIDADDLETLETDPVLGKHAADSLLSNANPQEKAQTCETIQGRADFIPCGLNEYIFIRFGKPACTKCLAGSALPYGDFEVCGRGLCATCPFRLDSSSQLCVTEYQEKVLKQQVIPQVVDGNVDLSTTNSVEKLQTFVAKSPLLEGEDTKFAVNTINLQMTSCATGLTCCLPGFYGASSSSCTECPSDKPSSPFSAPNSNCQCPNSASNKCFACNNKCRPYDSVSRMCVPDPCPSGQTCKVQSGAATCV
jgi:hypothetical protein